MSRPHVFAANWKMNLGPAAAAGFFDRFLPLCPPEPGRRLLFFPSALSLHVVAAATRERADIEVGAQNLFWERAGAFTGELAAPMLAEAGASFTLVGHSERRHVFGETVEDTVRKCVAAAEAELGVVLCVGETLEERRQGRAQDVVRAQLLPVLDMVSPHPQRWMVAYEPAWAIGTGENAAPDDAQEMHAAVREMLGASGGMTPVLYGGSVKPQNVAELLRCADVDGVLVGGASLDPGDFAAICAGGS
ncbi:MAG: triose-phosphate isomerase [Gemmatimonadota bacterium]|nr:triose-phosphate isomerase [Gemmatimonadota bacterium]